MKWGPLERTLRDLSFLLVVILCIYFAANKLVLLLIESDDNNCERVLNGQKGSMSTYRCPQ